MVSRSQQEVAERSMAVLTGAAEWSPRPRGLPLPITDGFAQVWPEVEQPLRAYLASLGAARHQIDDLVQETATRALEHQVAFCDGSDLRRWCFVVARRAWIDEVRRCSRVAQLDEEAEEPDPASDEALRRVEDRHVLRQVELLLGHLRQADREALSDQALRADAVERNRRNVARHRARARLKVLIGPLSGAGVLGIALGWSRRVIRPAAVVAVPVAAFVALATTPAQVGQADAPAEAPRPSASAGGIARTNGIGPSTASPHFRRGEFPRKPESPTAPRTGASDRAAVRTVHPEAGVVAPGGTHLTVRRDDKAPGEPLICLNGDVANFCVDLEVDPAMPPAGADAFTGTSSPAAD